jgi:hypothetical protein
MLVMMIAITPSLNASGPLKLEIVKKEVVQKELAVSHCRETARTGYSVRETAFRLGDLFVLNLDLSSGLMVEINFLVTFLLDQFIPPTIGRLEAAS